MPRSTLVEIPVKHPTKCRYPSRPPPNGYSGTICCKSISPTKAGVGGHLSVFLCQPHTVNLGERLRVLFVILSFVTFESCYMNRHRIVCYAVPKNNKFKSNFELGTWPLATLVVHLNMFGSRANRMTGRNITAGEILAYPIPGIMLQLYTSM